MQGHLGGELTTADDDHGTEASTAMRSCSMTWAAILAIAELTAGYGPPESGRP
jgi:hypothetical protein